MSALISAEELRKILKQPHVRILDASYNQSPSSQGIPGAVDFGIDDVADPASPLAHTIPDATTFSAKVSALGIGNDDLVIVYDRQGVSMAASRAWWMFRLFGHGNVKILNGGLPAWVKAGGALAEKSTPAPSVFKATLKPELVKSLAEVRDNIAARRFTLLDARDVGRFRGDAPDPRPNVPSGHIPAAVNVPFMNLINPDGSLKTKDQLQKCFETAGVSLQSKLACSCGSGVTACVIALALHEIGRTDAAVYDGSWTEWSADPALPKAKGA